MLDFRCPWNSLERSRLIVVHGGGEDRFSDLPDEFVYDILCLLEMKDHARLMVVSKKC
jgi:hypothetical protein